MIKNERQLKITQKQARHFEQAIAQTKGKAVPDDTDPVIWKAYIEGMESQLSTMEREIAEYRFLKAGNDALPVAFLKQKNAPIHDDKGRKELDRDQSRTPAGYPRQAKRSD